LSRYRRYRVSLMTYNYSATQNNGRIVSASDAVTGETVSYTYDALNRLIAAANTTGQTWNESYSYDGFGNMTGKTSTRGTPANPQVDPYTNRARVPGDYGFDANGNWLGVPGPNNNNLINTWNVENQLVSNGQLDSSGNPFTYTYDPSGKRVLQYSVNSSFGPWGTLYFYGITGQRLATYHVTYVNSNNPPLQQSVSMYFGGRLLVPQDRLGSVRSNRISGESLAYFPWGEEEKQSNGNTTTDGTDKYATYFRDGTINGAGQDYANARYYNNSFGRFWSPDPAGNAHANDPQSLNRYRYAGNDPVNNSDPSGLDSILVPIRTINCAFYAADNQTCLVGFSDPRLCWRNGELEYSPVDCPDIPEPAGGPVVRQNPCPGIGLAMYNTINGIGMPKGKSLLQRVVEQIVGDPAKSTDHQVEIDGYRQRLKNLRREWRQNNCGDDDDEPPYGVSQWIDDTVGSKLRQYNQDWLQAMNDLAGYATSASSIVLLYQAESLLNSIAAFLASLGAEDLVFAL